MDEKQEIQKIVKATIGNKRRYKLRQSIGIEINGKIGFGYDDYKIAQALFNILEIITKGNGNDKN